MLNDRHQRIAAQWLDQVLPPAFAKSRQAISLIELLITIGIIGILVSLALPAVMRVRDVAVSTKCQNNLKQIGLALHHYHDLHGHLPQSSAKQSPRGTPATAILGWMALILPEIEQGDLYRMSEVACMTDGNPLHNPPHQGLVAIQPVYYCPADSRLSFPQTDTLGITAAFTSYIGILGVVPPGSRRGYEGSLGGPDGTQFAMITDGLSQTLMVGERPPPASLQAGWWYPGLYGDGVNLRGPNNGLIVGGGVLFGNDPCRIVRGTFGPGRLDNPCDRFHLWSLHSGGANFLLVDGSVRYLSYSAEPVVVAMASRSGGEIVDLP